MNDPTFLFGITLIVFIIEMYITYRKEMEIKDPIRILFDSVQIVVGLVFGGSLVLYGLNDEIILGLSEGYIKYMIAIAGGGIILFIIQHFYIDFIEQKNKR